MPRTRLSPTKQRMASLSCQELFLAVCSGSSGCAVFAVCSYCLNVCLFAVDYPETVFTYLNSRRLSVFAFYSLFAGFTLFSLSTLFSGFAFFSLLAFDTLLACFTLFSLLALFALEVFHCVQVDPSTVNAVSYL